MKILLSESRIFILRSLSSLTISTNFAIKLMCFLSPIQSFTWLLRLGQDTLEAIESVINITYTIKRRNQFFYKATFILTNKSLAISSHLYMPIIIREIIILFSWLFFKTNDAIHFFTSADWNLIIVPVLPLANP